MVKKSDLEDLNLDFFDEAIEDYNSLDGSQKVVVMKALEKIAENGQNLGEPLRNTNTSNLSGYRKVKIKREGIRIVYSITNSKVDITQIITIGNRADSEVYEEAHKRITNKKNK